MAERHVVTSLPAKVTVGDVVTCCNGHKVGRVLETLSLAQSITAEAVAMAAHAVVEERPGRTVCATCNHPVAKVLRDGRWSLRLTQGWVS